MAGELSTKALGEICRFSGGAGFPQRLQGAGVGEFPFIKVSDMELPGNGFRITKANNWVNEATRRELRAKAHPANSTVFAKIGVALTYNRRRLLTRPTIVDNNMMAAIPDETQVDAQFFYYLLKKTDFNAVVAGTALPYINASDLAKMEVEVPPLAEQKAIAAVLGALDDKIELNRQMNATLEAMARALFQSWFVDFDPVRAKLDTRQPAGLEPATAALFPDSFADSELGPIPKGWRATTLGEECERGAGNIQTGPFGTQLHASDYVDEGVPSIMPSDLRDNRIDISEIARIRESDAERLSVYRVQPGDVVYSRRGDVERRSLIRQEEAGWLCGTGCLRVRFGPNGLNPFFGASYLGSEDSRAWVVRHAVGATMPNLNTSILGALPMVVPPPELQARFAEFVGPWDERGTIALHQSRTLATLRDKLLPKLLSGELKVNHPIKGGIV